MKKIWCLLLCIALLAPVVPVMAEEKVTTYTYEQALAMAIKDLPSLVTLEESLKLLKEQLDELRKQHVEMERNRSQDGRPRSDAGSINPVAVNIVPIGKVASVGLTDLGGLTPEQIEIITNIINEMMNQMMTDVIPGYVAQIVGEMMMQQANIPVQSVVPMQAGIPTTIEQMRHTLKNMERQRDSMELNREIIRAGTELSLRNTLITIANHELDIKLMEANIELSEENVRRINMRKEYGLISETDQRIAEQTLAQNKTNLETLLFTVANEKQNLNKILQLPLSANIKVDWERKEVELPSDINKYIADQHRNAPTIKQKQLVVDTKKANRDFDKNDKDKELSLKTEHDQAVRDLNDAKLSLEAAIKQNRQNIDQLIKREESLQLDAEKANDQFKTVEANLKTGLVTQFELDSVAVSILNTEVAIEKNRNQLWILEFMFKNPYLIN